MSGDELVRCRGCGVMFLAARPATGPISGYHDPACRKAAHRARARDDAASEVADLALSSSHERLSVALAELSIGSLAKVRHVLREPSDRNLSRESWDGLCSSATSDPGPVVASLHKEI